MTRKALSPLVILCLSIVIGTAAAQGPAQSADSGPAARAAERMRTLHEEADRLTTEERGVLGQLRRLELDRQIANEELRQAEAAAIHTGLKIERLDGQVQKLEAARDSERPQLEARLVEMYKLGSARYTRLLLSASDVRKLGQASRTVAALSARDRQRLELYGKRLEDLTAARQTLSHEEKELASKRAAASRARNATSRAIADRTALVREIDQRRDLNAQLSSELMAAQQKLESTIARSSDPTTAALPIGPFRGALPWPAAGRVQRLTGGAMAQRPGVGIQADEGTAVQAVHDGVVAFAGSFEGLGNLVILDHGSQTFTLYGYLLELSVGQGSTVAAHQTVGRVGAAPTGMPLLYFELRVNGRPVDPLAWLERTR